MDDEFQALIKKKNVVFINVDLTEKAELSKLPKDCDTVFHLAAINGTRFFYEIPHLVLKTNALTLMNILDWCASACPKLVWTSSSEVYAAASSVTEIPVPTNESVPLVIDDVYNRRYSYGGSKIFGELLCLNYARANKLQVTIIRPHNIYGPRMGTEHVIPEFILRIIGREKVFKIYGGEQTRAFCYIDDFVKACALVNNTPGLSNQIFHIGSDKDEIKINDLARKMFDLFGFHPEIQYLDPPEGSVARRCPDITKARISIKYEPHISLEDGLVRTYNWYAKHC